MNLDHIREEIKSLQNKELSFIYKGTRNQKETFTGTIIEVYQAIFIIKLLDGSIKSFSYNDYIIKNLKIMQ